MITVRVVRRIFLPPSLVSNIYKDSGVVTTMCGGRRRIAWRTAGGVSPVRTSVRISTSGKSRTSSSSRIAATGCWRLRWMSLLSAFSGET